MTITFSKATKPTKDNRKSWKVWGASRKYPKFEAIINRRGFPASCPVRGMIWERTPVIDVTKMHAGGIGSIWALDAEDCDKLIELLKVARAAL